MRIIPRHIIHAQREQDLAKVVAIVSTVGGESAVSAKTKLRRNTAADTRVLRMIPVTAEGVGSTIPGTQPLAALIANEHHLERHGLRSIH